MKQVIWTREGQRGLLSQPLSTASDSDSNEERKSAPPGLNRRQQTDRWRDGWIKGGRKDEQRHGDIHK